MIAAPHGGRTEIQVDSVTYPDINNIDDVLSWYYAGVTDGNAIIVYGNKESGYKVKTKNVTKKASSFSEFIANAVSKVYSKKGPYKGLDNAKDIKGHWTIDNNNPNGAAPLINIRAQEIARDRNIQEIQKLNGISVSPIDSSNSNLSNGNGIIFNNINFNSSGNAYIGFNGFSGGCTK